MRQQLIRKAEFAILQSGPRRQRPRHGKRFPQRGQKTVLTVVAADVLHSQQANVPGVPGSADFQVTVVLAVSAFHDPGSPDSPSL